MDKELAAVRGLKEMVMIEPIKRDDDESEDFHAILFSKLFELFLDHMSQPNRNSKAKKPITKKVRENLVRDFGRVRGIIGDIPINKISKEMLKDSILDCRMSPSLYCWLSH